jgi:hypothetical protein
MRKKVDWNTVTLSVLICVAIVGPAAYVFEAYGRRSLARDIANGTHEIRWDTNEFGTREVRIVEITDDTTN